MRHRELLGDAPDLVAELSGVEGIEDLALTTNGVLLAQHAAELKGNGLRRVTVSLDSLDDEVFRAMNDVDFPVERVLPDALFLPVRAPQPGGRDSSRATSTP